MSLKSRSGFFSLVVFFAAGISLLSAQTLLPPAQPYAIRGSAGIGAWSIPPNEVLEFSGGFTIESWICPRAMGWT